MLIGDRSREDVWLDILRAIHFIARSGYKITPSRIGDHARVPNSRLKDRLMELRDLGLVDDHLAITREGYGYFEDYRRFLEPFGRKYGLARTTYQRP